MLPGNPPSRPLLTGHVLNDIIALGTHALVAHVGQLLVKRPIRVIQESAVLTRIRVCGAFDYVIDRSKNYVWAESAPLTRQERCASQQPPWYPPLEGKLYSVDLLNPLCRPGWLNYIAARPGWFGYAFSKHKGTQKQLFVEQDDMAHALQMVTHAAWHHMAHDQAFVALRQLLTTVLTLHLGHSAVSLAMRSRLDTNNISLNAGHMSLVLRYQPAFETMARENPRLLPGLTAWLLHHNRQKSAISPTVVDALPLMRRDVLTSGLQPKAWRYLAQHGFKRLQPYNAGPDPWVCMLQTLRSLAAAHWPALPPRRFLRMLHDTAGYPLDYEHTGEGTIAGWFWQLVCNQAHACLGDTGSYNYLFDQIPQWAWMVRHYQLKPDKNQRRKGLEWLESMRDVVQTRASQDSLPTWALWLPAEGWNPEDDGALALKIVPLQSAGALRQEAFALHNCADAFEGRCRAETHVLLSLRERATNKVVALASVKQFGQNWVLNQLSGPCNQAVSFQVRQVAQQAAVWVRHHHGQRPTATIAPDAPLDETAADDDIHMLFMDV